MNDTVLLAIVGIFGSLFGYLFRDGMMNLARLLDTWQKNKEAQRAAVASQESRIIDRQEQQIARLELQVKEQQKAIEEIQGAHADCREESAELRLLIAMLREDMIAAGLKPRDIPPPRKQGSDPGFIARTEAQKTVLAAAIDARLQKDKSEGGHADPDS